MRRSSMRRGSAVLLTILPLLSPAYALPTYFGNEAAVSHANIERAAIAEPAVNLDTDSVTLGSDSEETIPNIASEGPEHWLPRSKRQATTGVSGSSSISLDVDQNAGEDPVATGKESPFIPNIASEGPSHWLGSMKREAKPEAEAEAEAKASPAVTLDMDYVPPPLGAGSLNLGAPNSLRRRRISL
ncbi:MAG: hypothetical protein Q9201_007199 [Fulgogasparrea decipioides]